MLSMETVRQRTGKEDTEPRVDQGNRLEVPLDEDTQLATTRDEVGLERIAEPKMSSVKGPKPIVRMDDGSSESDQAILADILDKATVNLTCTGKRTTWIEEKKNKRRKVQVFLPFTL